MANILQTISPPSPPKILQSSKSKSNSFDAQLIQKKPLLEECLWAVEYPQLQKACFLARICLSKSPKSCKFKNVESILQVGPTCGLTALSMLLGGIPSAALLLREARQRHFSNNGEMFSARQLFELVCDNIPIMYNNNDISSNDELQHKQNAKVTENGVQQDTATIKKMIECHLHEGHLDCAEVRELLLQGACMLVPYDPDFNHAPCHKMGHKAHWALIIGYLITENEGFYVLSRHGKAKNLAVWSLCSLSDSNANLYEFAQPNGYPDLDFLLPAGGIGGNLGLRERAIIVKGLQMETTTIC